MKTSNQPINPTMKNENEIKNESVSHRAYEQPPKCLIPETESLEVVSQDGSSGTV